MCGKVIAVPGRRDELVDVLLEAAEVVGQMPECELYVVSTVRGEDDAIWVTELWASEEAHTGSLGNDEVHALIGRGRPLIAEFAQQVRFTPVGGTGLRA
jgi:quinol monooxygenase YgiN